MKTKLTLEVVIDTDKLHDSRLEVLLHMIEKGKTPYVGDYEMSVIKTLSVRQPLLVKAEDGQ